MFKDEKEEHKTKAKQHMKYEICTHDINTFKFLA